MATRSGRASAMWPTLGILVTLQMLSFFDKQLLGMLLAPLGKALELSDVQLGLAQGIAFSIPYCLATIGFGFAADASSPRILLFFAVILWSLGSISTGLAGGFASLVIARAVLGIGEAALQPCGYRLLAYVTPPAMAGTAVAIYTAGGVGVAGLLLVAGGWGINLLNSHGGLTLPVFGHLAPWSASFVLFGIPSLATAVLALGFPVLPRRQPATGQAVGRPGGRAGGQRRRGELADFLRSHRLLLSCHYGAMAALSVCLYAVMAWTPAYLLRVFAMDYGQIGLIFGVGSALGSAAGIAWGMISDRMATRGVRAPVYKLFFWLVVLGIPVGVAAFTVRSIPLFSVLFTLSWMLMMAFAALSSTLQMFAPLHLLGRLIAIQAFVLACLGAGVAPLLVAGLTELIFQDPARVGDAIAIVIGTFGSVAAILLRIAAEPYAYAVDVALPSESAGAGLSAGGITLNGAGAPSGVTVRPAV